MSYFCVHCSMAAVFEFFGPGQLTEFFWAQSTHQVVDSHLCGNLKNQQGRTESPPPCLMLVGFFGFTNNSKEATAHRRLTFTILFCLKTELSDALYQQYQVDSWKCYFKVKEFNSDSTVSSEQPPYERDENALCSTRASWWSLSQILLKGAIG